MNWIRNLPFPVKLGAITAVMLAPVLLLGFFFLQTRNDGIAISENIAGGLHHYGELEKMLAPLGARPRMSAVPTADIRPVEPLISSNTSSAFALRVW